MPPAVALYVLVTKLHTGAVFLIEWEKGLRLALKCLMWSAKLCLFLYIVCFPASSLGLLWGNDDDRLAEFMFSCWNFHYVVFAFLEKNIANWIFFMENNAQGRGYGYKEAILAVGMGSSGLL